jgi:SOS-response transcriptional repressor LexA
MTVSRWVTGASRIDEPLQAKVAKALGVSVEQLLACFAPKAGTGLPPSPAAEPARRHDVRPITGEMELREVNYYGEICAGRREVIFDGIPLHTDNIFMKIPSGKKVGIFLVTGDCMDDNTPDAIHEGDKIVVVEQSWAAPRDVVVCLLDDHLTLKQIKHIDGETVLYPRNPKHKPRVVKGEFKILGVVLRIFRDLKR